VEILGLTTEKTKINHKDKREFLTAEGAEFTELYSN
jgi:hypothetical protein